MGQKTRWPAVLSAGSILFEVGYFTGFTWIEAAGAVIMASFYSMIALLLLVEACGWITSVVARLLKCR